MKNIIFDFSRVLLFPADPKHTRGLNELYKKVKEEPNFNFLKYFVFNDELLQYLHKHTSDTNFYLLTSEIIQNDPVSQEKLKDIFKKIISASDFHDLSHNSKEEPELYAEVLKTIGKRPGEVIFIDDNMKNVEAARAAGLEAHQYTSNQETMLLIDEHSGKQKQLS